MSLRREGGAANDEHVFNVVHPPPEGRLQVAGNAAFDDRVGAITRDV